MYAKKAAFKSAFHGSEFCPCLLRNYFLR